MIRRILFSLGLFLLWAFLAAACQPTATVKTNSSAPENRHVTVQNSVLVNSNTATPKIVKNNPTPKPSAATDDEDSEMLESSPDAAKQPYDLQFIDTMIQHHQAAIVMAKMVLANSQNQELRKFAQKIIGTQEKEIEQMETWRDAWYPYKLDAINMNLPGMHDSMKRMVSDEMDKMQNATGKEFDDYFFEMMIPHHQGAVTMAKDALAKNEHPDLKILAQEIISQQEAEINQMTSWQTGGKK